MVFGADAVRGEVAAELSATVGPDSATAVQGMIRSAAISGSGVLATTLGIAVLVVGATSVFAELQSALDRIWHVPEAQKPSGVWGILRARVFSFGLVLGLAFLLMVSLSISAALAALGAFIGGLVPVEELLLQGLNIFVSMAVTTVLFAMIFKFMPTTPVAWQDVWVGAGVTAVLFEVGKSLIGIYLGKSGMANSFAGAGSLVLLLAWVYYASQIFLLGAEFTKVYAQEHGSVSNASIMQGTVPELGGATVATALPDYSALAKTDRMQHEVDERVAKASRILLPKLIMLGAMTVLSIFAEKRTKELVKRRRAAKASRAKE
jgi:membrane protein